jgi:hypothetical protein
MLLPDCPRCVLSRSKHADGIKIKHTPSGAAAFSAGGKRFVSYHVPGFDAQAVAAYMGSGVPVSTPTGGAISGCEVYLNTEHDSINAVSRLPLGQIPGSGITPSGQYAAQHATLCDIEGKSGDGPHYLFESDADKARKIAGGIYVPLPPCSRCGIVPWRPGQLCPSCAHP